ncbi:hypothetical protein G3489_19325 [Shewanella baltica]|uniref:DNA-binding protein n=1 Tax=Shewanella baltica TaxID=62322 RepID=UPI00217E2F84|nr:DNA-binding protein [Shewanella baltica]MCS6271828.1 hypothetical protein [Shewanella baltica]
MTTTTEQSSIQDRVTAICNDLYAKGTKPSVRMVLSMLPDISSTSTVHKYFATWRKELEANQQSLYDKLGFSSEFTQSFMKEITRFGVEAEQRYKELSLDANEQRDLAIEDLGRSEERLHKQTALLEQKQKEVNELQKELLKIQENSKADLAKEQESNRVIVKELRTQLSDYQKTSKDLANTNETLRTDIAKAELKLEGNESYVQEVKEQNLALTASNNKLLAELAALNKVVARHEATEDGNNKLITNLEARHVEMQGALKQLEAERQNLISETAATRKDLEVVRSYLAETKDKLNTESTQLAELKSSMAELTRSTDKTIASYETTIKGNEKLISQMESAQTNLNATITELKSKLVGFISETVNE